MISCGFFNAVNGDRTYNAEQMNNPYKRIVSNGVFANGDGTQSNDMKVIADGTLTLKVSKGDGIFAGKWANIDAPYNAIIQTPDTSLPRIDSVVFSIDYINRQGIVGVVKGTPAAIPTPPAIMRTNNRMDYRLANVRVSANATGITQSDVTDTRAGSDCGFITSLLQQPDITSIYDQWQAQFEDWFQDIKETLATSTLIRSYTSRYVTLTQGETVIPINISQYNKNLDILQVFVNGLRLIPTEEYTIDSNSQITLAADVDSGTPVSFVVYKSVDGSDAETVVQQVYELQVKLDATRITDQVGGVKYNVSAGENMLDRFMSLGMGFHTLYAPSTATGIPKTGVFRCFGQMTNSNNGWIFAMAVDGSVYSNYVYGGEWRGWKVIYETSQEALYYTATGVFPSVNVVVTPSKPLNACAHGWQLVFNLYSNSTSLNNCVQTFNIPKKSNNNANWDGENIIIPLMFQTNDGFEMTQKLFSVTNESLVSSAYNSAGSSRNLVLRAIYEY